MAEHVGVKAVQEVMNVPLILHREGTTAIWSGRPDILLEIYKAGQSTPWKVIIGEVKHTTKSETASQGLRQLLEYIMMSTCQGQRLVTLDSPFAGVSVVGILFLDDMKISNADISPGVRVISFGQGAQASLSRVLVPVE
jgi:hypothetical protein